MPLIKFRPKVSTHKIYRYNLEVTYSAHSASFPRFIFSFISVISVLFQSRYCIMRHNGPFKLNRRILTLNVYVGMNMYIMGSNNHYKQMKRSSDSAHYGENFRCLFKIGQKHKGQMKKFHAIHSLMNPVYYRNIPNTLLPRVSRPHNYLKPTNYNLKTWRIPNKRFQSVSNSQIQ